MIRDDLDAGRLYQLSEVSVLEGAGYYALRAEHRSARRCDHLLVLGHGARSGLPMASQYQRRAGSQQIANIARNKT